MRQGRVEEQVNQTVGLLFFILTRLFALAVCGVLALSGGVFLRHGTLRADAILRRDPEAPSPLERFLSTVWVLCSLPLGAILFRLLF